jgi:hypothetical protein
MTPLQTAEIRAGELRIRLAELGGMAELDTETRAELDTLRTEYTDTERRMAALRIAEPDRTPIVSATSEGSEYRAMLDRANIGTIFDDLLAHRNPSGVEAELQAHLHLGGNQLPLDMLRGAGGGGGAGLEFRAVTPAPGQVSQNQMPTLPYIFPQSAAAFLGVDMPTVGVGDAVYPVLTSTLAVGTPAENAAQAETTGAFTAAVLVPHRLQAAFFYSREDRARFAGMDAALRENLSDGLADGLDDQILSGTDGLLAGTNLANNNVTATDTFDSYLSNLVWNQIDGRYASMASELAMVVGAETYKDLGATYRNTSVDRSALDRVMELVSGVRVSAHVPAADGTNHRQNVVIRRGMSMTATAPVWEWVTIIPDEITKASNGQIVITAVMLYAVKVLRTGAGLVKQQVDHS